MNLLTSMGQYRYVLEVQRSYGEGNIELSREPDWFDYMFSDSVTLSSLTITSRSSEQQILIPTLESSAAPAMPRFSARAPGSLTTPNTPLAQAVLRGLKRWNGSFATLF